MTGDLRCTSCGQLPINKPCELMSPRLLKQPQQEVLQW
jgi:hypothetical protein